MKYTQNMKIKGEMAVRKMNEKAKNVYEKSEFEIYEYETENWKDNENYQIETKYSIYTNKNKIAENITFEETEKILESFGE